MSKIIREFIKVMEFFAIAFCVFLAMHVILISLLAAHYLSLSVVQHLMHR